MASPGNPHCASCIGTLSVPVLRLACRRFLVVTENYNQCLCVYAFSAFTLLVGRQERHPAGKKTEQRGAGMVICLVRGADLHMAQWIPLPLTVPCFSKIQIDFTFLGPAHPGSPGQRAIKRLCVCVCVFCINRVQ